MAARRATADLGLGREAAGHAVAQAPPRRSPLPPRHFRPHQPSLLMDQATLAAVVAAQMLNLLSISSALWKGTAHPDGAWSLLALPALVQLLNMLVFAVVVCWPQQYWRNRGWLLPLLLVLPALPTSTRQAGVGAALVLERPARPGLWGLVADVLRATGGAPLPAPQHNAE